LESQKSIYKHVIWPKFKEQRSGAVPDNDLIAFYNAIRMLAKKDFSFDRNLPGWDNAEKIWLA